MVEITTTTATSDKQSLRLRRQDIPAGFHVLAAAWLAGMLVSAHILPAAYESAMQEDRFVEWWTAVLFACAGIVRLIAAVRTRRPFDLLVALFCIFVAGEEISWGQRLFGFTPPTYFLAHNTQQEFSIHNFADVFGKPKNVLMLALAGFGIVLPLLGLERRGRELLERVGATAPPLELLPWFASAIALLFWYPVEFTGEWVEVFAGALFVIGAIAPRRVFAATAILALMLTGISSAIAQANPQMLACARAEAAALLHDIGGSIQTDDRLVYRNVHKRVQTAVQDGYFYSDLARFAAVQCAGEPADAAARRRKFAIDPWGLAYWVRSEPGVTGTIITVYSFGPNRRRDSEPGGPAGDDVMRLGRVAP